MLHQKKQTTLQAPSRAQGHRSTHYWIMMGTLVLALLSLAGCGAAASAASASTSQNAKTHRPVQVTVFSPGQEDKAGKAGAGYVIDLSLDASTPADNSYLSAANGYKPFFNDPNSTTFHPGPDQGAPGLVVLLSTTKTIPGTAFKGPGTNLAGLFQINGVAMVNEGTIAETWNTWLVGKPIAGAGVKTTLTVFVVKGTAPAFIHGDPEEQPGLISNVVRVQFTIAGATQE